MSNNRVEVHVGAKTSELKKGMNEAESIVKDTAQEIEVTGKKVDFQIDVSGVQKTFENLSSNISTQMLGLGKKIAAGIGSALAVDGLVSFTRNAISTASEVQKMSDMLGESVEDFQYFSKGAETAGLSLEQFGMMGKDALDRLGEARRGEGEMMDFFEKVAPKIGVTIDMFKDLSGPEVIQAYYDGLEKANLSHAETITYMEQIINDGSLLIPLLKDGGTGFKKWGEEAKNAGAIMSKDMVDNLGKAKENLYTLELQFQGFQAILINSVTPAVTAIAQNFDNIKAVAIALGAAISAKLVVQCAVLAKEFVIGVAQGMAYQMQLSALQGQAMRTATAMGVLRSASVLLGGPAGLGMLAFQGLAAGAAFLYMKRSSDEAVPALSTQGKTVAQLREEYEKLDKAQQRVLTRQATTDLSKAEQGFRKQEIALLGLVRALISHSDASEADKKTAKDLYDQYLQGKLNADQLATGINNLRTVEAKHKTGIDEKAAAVNKERKAVIDAQGVLKTYNDVVKQGTKDNKSHTDSINDKANALANLTAKQMEYVRESNKQSERERYIQHNMKVGGVSRERAEHMADARDKAGMGYTAKDGAMPEAVKQAEEADWKRKQAAEAREDAEKKAEEKLKEQTKELEKQQQILQVNARVKANAEKFNYAGFEAKYGLPSGMLSALNMQETKGRNVEGVQTKYGTAKGNFQMLDMTAKRFGVTDPFDTKQAAEGAAKYMRFLLDKYGDINKAISAYHAGEGNVDRGTGIGPVNRQYVKNVKGYMAGVNGVEAGTDASAYEKTLQEQVSKADEAEKQKLALQYKYADARKQIAIDLDNDIKEIEKSTLSGDEQINAIVMANQQASDKLKAIDIENLEHRLSLNELEISGREILADRIYEIEMAQLQALFDAGKISNVDKVNLEKELQDKLTAVKRIGLEGRLDLEMQLGALTGDPKGIATASNNLGALDHQKSLSDINQPKKLDDAQLADFEEKFGGLTSRMSSLWDKGIQAMLNGTLTWKGAMNAIFSELAAEFVQNMITAPMKKYAANLATRLAVKLGFIKTETAAEVMGQTAQTGAVVAGETTKTMATSTGALARLAIKAGEAIKSIMMYAWEAMAGAFKAMVSIPYIGPVLAVAAGASALALVGGLAGKIKSARGGYDIPAGVNPVTQLHEEEMVLPKQHANTIRALGKNLTSDGGIGGGGGSSAQTFNNFTIQAWDSKDVRRFMEKHGRELASGLKGHRRNFGT
ncbi:lytic transglycosylase domain-containing protein [Acinetobacter johnsonii]|uniref:lytic transglycosylase domain-containing protein n=1 Tax=Acinetobacter johnsonii TaxID=40214 RepID=UPI001D0F041F|nr:lytic transglycosylase domain-containing protein [Acinetobacter johnsonii]